MGGGSLQVRTLAEMPADAALAVPLPDGRMLSFPASRLRAMLGVVLELFDPHALDDGGRLRLSRLRAAELSGAGNAAEWRWLGSHELSELNAKLRNFGGIQPVPVSPNLKAVLRGYQQEGLDWLQFLRAYDLGGVLEIGRAHV